MTRFFILLSAFVVFPFAAHAIEAPTGQIHIDTHTILRGRFVEEHQMNGGKNPMRSSGHFIVAPANGLIWSIEQPFPTSTIITPNGAVQDLGGVAVKLSVKNLHHLYNVVGGALAGDWYELEADYIITRGGNAQHWQMLMTPRPEGKSKLPYATITVSGSRFVENILMTKSDGNYDSLAFTDAALSPTPLTAKENAFFNEVRQ